MKIADKGADIVRITVQGKKKADACFDIKNTLIQKGYDIPLVADIHFAPSVALRVAECFDKIRDNPGNFADRRAQFQKLEYTDEDYQKELQHIEEVFTPLVEKCKKYGRAMRIGTNHGSLSDRIMSYYGDSPRGNPPEQKSDRHRGYSGRLSTEEKQLSLQLAQAKQKGFLQT